MILKIKEQSQNHLIWIRKNENNVPIKFGNIISPWKHRALYLVSCQRKYKNLTTCIHMVIRYFRKLPSSVWNLPKHVYRALKPLFDKHSGSFFEWNKVRRFIIEIYSPWTGNSYMCMCLRRRQAGVSVFYGMAYIGVK